MGIFASVIKTLAQISVLSGAFLFTCAASAQIIQDLPTPMQQGGMVHAMVTFKDQPTNTFSVHLEAGTPEMRSLVNWSGFGTSTFDPADPWYSSLDPTQENRLFSSRYGFMVNASASDFLPADTSIGIRMTARSTTGLNAYFYNSSTPTFDPVFLSSATQGLCALEWDHVAHRLYSSIDGFGARHCRI